MTSVKVTVIRHKKERISKCSLRFLHDRPGFTFLRAGKGFRFDATCFLLLEVDAPALCPADQDHPLLLLDSTWRWLPELRAAIIGEPLLRSIPGDIVTSYPRESRLFRDPEQGLASIEALYIAKRILGEDDPSLLDGYHWKQEFLAGVRSSR